MEFLIWLVILGVVVWLMRRGGSERYDPSAVRFPGAAWVYPCFWCRDEVWTAPGTWQWRHVSNNAIEARNPEEPGTHKAKPYIELEPELIRSWRTELEPELTDDVEGDPVTVGNHVRLRWNEDRQEFE